MDYLLVGSNGFAQVGYPDFYEKNRIEIRVLMEYIKTNFPIPEEFSHMCDYRVKWFTHDFGRYSEIVLIYNDYILNRWDENDPDKFNRFWDWFNHIEAVDMESDYLNNEIRARYQNYVTKNSIS